MSNCNRQQNHRDLFFMYVGIMLGAGFSFFSSLFVGFYFKAVGEFDVGLFLAVSWVFFGIVVIILILTFYNFIQFYRNAQ